MSKVVKFGGSSLASAEQFKKVGNIIRADKERKYVVPSAPGKRFSNDTKVTDMLYACYDLADQGKVIMCFWDKEEVKLVDTRESVRSFFIRAKAGAEGAVEAAFPGGRELHLADRKEDFGYFTQPMKESEFLAKYEALGEQMLGRIRLV